MDPLNLRLLSISLHLLMKVIKTSPNWILDWFNLSIFCHRARNISGGKLITGHWADDVPRR